MSTTEGSAGDCGCCKGVDTATPVATANRPGLDALKYRIGTHGAFLAGMTARLSMVRLDNQNPLAGLTTRAPDDPTMALLDAWATTADVLSFYQERIANEGYLRTATERKSLVELGRLVGYAPRPGVAASAFLAFTLDDEYKIEIPAGTRAQSVPVKPDELPQFFETSEPLQARSEWNEIKPRLTRPQKIDSAKNTLYFKGTATNLKAGDAILIEFEAGPPRFARVATVQTDPANDRTRATVQTPGTVAPVEESRTTSLENLVGDLLIPVPETSIPPKRSVSLKRDIATTFGANSDVMPKLLMQLHTNLKAVLYQAWKRATVTDRSVVAVYAFRTEASVFGHNAPLKPITRWDGVIIGHEEWSFARYAREIEEKFEVSGTVYERIVEGENKQPRIRLELNIDGATAEIDREVEDGADFIITMQEKNEKVEVELSRPGDRLVPLTVRLRFLRRGIKLEIALDAEGKVNVSAAGSDPTIVTIAFSQAAATVSGRGSGGVVVKISGSVETRQRDGFTELRKVISLDAAFPGIQPDTWIALLKPKSGDPVIFGEIGVRTRSRVDYGLSAKVTEITLKKKWISPDKDSFDIVRGTTVFAQSESLELAEAPILDEEGKLKPVCGNRIEIDGLYQGLEPGRWLVVAGDRIDIDGVTGLKGTELAMLAGVEQSVDENLPGDTTNSTLLLANTLAYKYKRDTVKIYGNVVNASHGESRIQVLGSGDARKSGQTFPLAFKPLTFLAAPTAKGADSTLAVRVNEVLWPESDSPVGLGPDDRGYYTRTDEEDNISVVFGGARLPTGIENVTAEYRQGIGRGANVDAERISQLATQPLGVSKVINPLRASGGADADRSEVVRRNAPLEVMALDRLVSVQDYADFARRFAGIAKADARRLSLGRRHVIHVTIAAVADAPIDETSDLFLNLQDALRLQGDPYVPVEVAARELLLLVIVANVRVRPDYRWESVEPSVRSVMLDTFSFDRRHLGQDVVLGDVIRTIHNVDGVQYVDVDVLGYVPQDIRPSGLPKLVKRLRSQDQSRVASKPARAEGDKSKPAQLAYLSPELPDTLLLQEIRG